MYSFDDMIGNGPIIESIRNAIARKKTAHAYIIGGGEGAGKTMLAKTIAKTMQCENNSADGKADPCMCCVSCRTFDSGNHPDVVYVASAARKSIGVDDVREQIGERIMIKPYKYEYKIFIIKDAHTMTPAAQNALLKTLEEPAGYGVFLLTSSNLAGLIPTVLSRSAVLKLRPVADELIRDHLIGAGFTREEADVCSACVRGSVGTALKRRNDERFAAARELVFETVLTHDRSVCGAFTAAARCEPYKDMITDILDMFYVLYRDILVYKVTGDMSRIIERGRADEIAAAAGGTSVRSLIKKLGAVTNTGAMLRYNVNFMMAVNMLARDIMEVS